MLIDVHIVLFCLKPLKTKSIGSQYLPRFSWKYRLYFKGNLENHILFTVKYLEKNIVFNNKTWNFMILILYEPCGCTDTHMSRMLLQNDYPLLLCKNYLL